MTNVIKVKRKQPVITLVKSVAGDACHLCAFQTNAMVEVSLIKICTKCVSDMMTTTITGRMRNDRFAKIQNEEKRNESK